MKKVSWNDDIPYMKWKIPTVPKHQPDNVHVYPSKMGPSQELGERLGDPIRREKEVKVQLSSLGAVGMNTAYTML